MASNLTPREWVVGSLGVTALLWYLACLIVLGSRPWPIPPPPPPPDPVSFYEFMSLSLTTIGATLAAFVGVVLGIQTVAKLSSRPAAELRSSLPTEIQQYMKDVDTATTVSNFQWATVGLYVVSLLVALVFWGIYGEQAHEAIRSLGKSLLGLMAGALGIILNTKKTQ